MRSRSAISPTACSGGAADQGRLAGRRRPLSRDDRIALQKKLAALGYKVNDFEGHVDFDLRDFIRAEQKKLGMVPDGHPTAALLEQARGEGAVISAARLACGAVAFSASSRAMSSR